MVFKDLETETPFLLCYPEGILRCAVREPDQYGVCCTRESRAEGESAGGRTWGPPDSARPQRTGVKGHWPCAQCVRPATCWLAGEAEEQETPL